MYQELLLNSRVIEKGDGVYTAKCNPLTGAQLVEVSNIADITIAALTIDPSALGTKAAANSLSVTPASDSITTTKGQTKTPYFLTSAGALANIKATGGILSWVSVRNTFDFDIYVQLFNALVANITLGTTTPILSLVIPAQGFLNEHIELDFSTAISYAVTDTAAGLNTKIVTINATYK